MSSSHYFLPHKIHYQIFDALGRVERVLEDNDAKDTTGVAGVDNNGDAVKGIESIISYERDIYGNVTETRNNLNAQGEVEEKVYTVRDAHGRETAKYWNLDNNVNTGTGNVDQDPAIRTTDGRTLAGIERYETYSYDANGNLITKNSNLDAKGGFENIEYYDVNKATGEREGVYYNRDNDSKDNAPLAVKTGETVTLKDGRTVEGIDNFTTYEHNEHKQVIQENFNLDAKGAFDRVYYYDLDINGNRVGEYHNLDNDTTKTLSGESQITGTTHQLADGREVSGIERYYTREFDSNNRLMKIENNLDGKGQYESVTYYEHDGYGREVLRYTNTNNDMLSNGTPNPTGHSYTITQNGEAVTVNGIDQVVRTTYNEYGSVTKVETNNTGEAGDDKFTHVTTNEYNERRQKVADESTVNGQTSAANGYTYEIYGRQETRSFDTDFSKDGFERTESYYYNQYGDLVRRENNVLGNELAIDSMEKIDRDLFGRDTIIRRFQSDGTLTEKVVQEYDNYNYRVEERIYSSETALSRIRTSEFDEYGRVKSGWEDNNGNRIYDSGDTKFTLGYSDDSRNLVIRRQSNTINANGVETNQDYHYSYNDRGLRITEFVDKNNNQIADSNEVVTHISYIKDTGVQDKFEYSNGMDIANKYRELKFIYPDAGESGRQIAAMDSSKSRDWDTKLLYGVHNAHYSTKDDYTSGNWSKLLDEYKGKIYEIALTNQRANTEITLDNDVIAKIAKQKNLLISGDATDTINLKDSQEFTKLDATVKQGSNDYSQYTTEVGGTTYTVLIDTDVNVNML